MLSFIWYVPTDRNWVESQHMSACELSICFSKLGYLLHKAFYKRACLFCIWIVTFNRVWRNNPNAGNHQPQITIATQPYWSSLYSTPTWLPEVGPASHLYMHWLCISWHGSGLLLLHVHNNSGCGIFTYWPELCTLLHKCEALVRFVIGWTELEKKTFVQHVMWQRGQLWFYCIPCIVQYEMETVVLLSYHRLPPSFPPFPCWLT